MRRITCLRAETAQPTFGCALSVRWVHREIQIPANLPAEGGTR